MSSPRARSTSRLRPSRIPYPYLEDLGDAQRNAGYATSSTVDPEGRPVVVTWIEEHVGEAPRTLQWRILANTWMGVEGSEWVTQSLGTSPIFAAGLEFLRGTAVAYGPDGALWLGSSEGEVAVWRDGALGRALHVRQQPAAGRPADYRHHDQRHRHRLVRHPERRLHLRGGRRAAAADDLHSLRAAGYVGGEPSFDSAPCSRRSRSCPTPCPRTCRSSWTGTRSS